MQTTLVEQIAAQAATLPVQHQRLTLQLIESMRKAQLAPNGASAPRHLRIKGVTATGEGPTLTLESLREARKEMWGEYMEADE